MRKGNKIEHVNHEHNSGGNYSGLHNPTMLKVLISTTISKDIVVLFGRFPLSSVQHVQIKVS